MDYFADDGFMTDTETADEDDEVKAEPVDQALDVAVHHERRVRDVEDVKLFPSREVQRNHWHRTTMAAFALQDSYHMPADIQFTSVRRVEVISKVLGGSPQPAFTRGRDGRDMLFATPEQTPFLPRAPGQNGLFFTFSWRAKGGPTSIVRLFVRDPHEAKWLYMGEYKNKEMRAMSREEWNMQSEAVKALRVKSLAKRKYAAAQAIRGRIVERKKVKAESGDESSEDAPANDDFRDALDDGREQMLVIALQCVGYEASVQKRLRDFALGGNSVAIPTPKSTSRRAKRRRSASESDSEGEKSNGQPSDRERPAPSPPVSARARRQPARTVRRRVVYAESESE